MLAALLTVSQALVGYADVSYESKSITPAQYEYFVPVEGTHYTSSINYAAWGIQTVNPISPFEIYEPPIGSQGWRLSPFTTPIAFYPTSNQWGRRWVSESINWNPSGNVGYKTLAEWNALQADVTAGTKRNLIGTPVYQ